MAAARGLEALRIAEALEEMPSAAAPPEVEAALLSLGLPPLTRCERLKVSFHATFFLDFAGPLPGQTGGAAGRAVLQLIGSELGDKPFFHLGRPISAASIEKALSLAQELGIRVPHVLASGQVEEWGPLRAVPFIVYEFIDTRTVEDEVIAPEKEWRRIFGELRGQLEARSMAGVDTEPLPRFEDCFAYVAYLSQLAAEAGADDLVQALARAESQLRERGVEAAPPKLIHQDLNGGNILCSPDPGGPSGRWRLDALVDWEGAVVGDPRVLFEQGEPWSALRRLAVVTKVRWLAARAAGLTVAGAGSPLPRCNAEELTEDYEEIASKLVRAGWLPRVVRLPRLA
mmetsp:Transcript_110524/g.345559  ORF Transcript_110524/g.345559 Transcript_110524/m.345559 type:complete len:343 (-) Transcript_110524:58-1086(-)